MHNFTERVVIDPLTHDNSNIDHVPTTLLRGPLDTAPAALLDVFHATGEWNLGFTLFVVLRPAELPDEWIARNVPDEVIAAIADATAQGEDVWILQPTLLRGGNGSDTISLLDTVALTHVVNCHGLAVVAEAWAAPSSDIPPNSTAEDAGTAQEVRYAAVADRFGDTWEAFQYRSSDSPTTVASDTHHALFADPVLLFLQRAISAPTSQPHIVNNSEQVQSLILDGLIFHRDRLASYFTDDTMSAADGVNLLRDPLSWHTQWMPSSSDMTLSDILPRSLSSVPLPLNNDVQQWLGEETLWQLLFPRSQETPDTWIPDFIQRCTSIYALQQAVTHPTTPADLELCAYLDSLITVLIGQLVDSIMEAQRTDTLLSDESVLGAVLTDATAMALDPDTDDDHPIRAAVINILHSADFHQLAPEQQHQHLARELTTLFMSNSHMQSFSRLLLALPAHETYVQTAIDCLHGMPRTSDDFQLVTRALHENTTTSTHLMDHVLNVVSSCVTTTEPPPAPLQDVRDFLHLWLEEIA